MQKLLGTFTSKWMYWDVEPYSIPGLVSRMLKIVAAVTSFRLILRWDDRSVSNENCLRLTPKPKWSVAIFSLNVNSQNAVEAQSIQFVVMKQVQECSAKTKTESKTKARAGQEQDPNQKIIPYKTKPSVSVHCNSGQCLAVKHLDCFPSQRVDWAVVGIFISSFLRTTYIDPNYLKLSCATA